jgi:hypothetical protein
MRHYRSLALPSSRDLRKRPAFQSLPRSGLAGLSDSRFGRIRLPVALLKVKQVPKQEAEPDVEWKGELIGIDAMVDRRKGLQISPDG